jgi:DNA modification methylase
MTPHYDHAGVTIYHGDARAVLSGLPAGSVNCCVTSPPYWGLRDYGTDGLVWGGDPEHGHVFGETIRGSNRGGSGGAGKNGRGEGYARDVERGQVCECGAWFGSLGLEPGPEMFVVHLVSIFREVWRVLRDDGTLWLNIGDSYATGAGSARSPGGRNFGKRNEAVNAGNFPPSQPNRMPIPGLKPKDLVGIPWMLAFALRADGWWLRSEIIWHKPNPMPESVTDRPTKAHEQIFLLAKSEAYFYDADAIKEPASPDTHERYARGRSDAHKYADGGPGGQTIAKSFDHMRPPAGWHQGTRADGSAPRDRRERKLAEPDSGIKNNSSFDRAMGLMPEFRNKRSVWTVPTQGFPEAHFATFPEALIRPCVLAGCPDGGLVLDPFTGSATTALVAKENGRRFVGAELKESYLAIARRRLRQEVLFPAAPEAEEGAR